jgi:hypothetical protein
MATSEALFANLFGVTAIPRTFTIGSLRLREEHVGDASIEGKLKTLRFKVDEPSCRAISVN